MQLSQFGHIAQWEWVKLRLRFPNVRLDKFVIMPNHVHGIIHVESTSHPVGVPVGNPAHVGATLAVALTTNESDNSIPRKRAGASPAPTYGNTKNNNATIGHIIGTYKSIVNGGCLSIAKPNRVYLGKIWQRNYYEHIIRDKFELDRIRKYITENPQNWIRDKFNHSI